MMKRLFILILLLSIPVLLFPCGNEYGYSLAGKMQQTRYFFLSKETLGFDVKHVQLKLSELSQEVLNDYDKSKYQQWSDIAINLMKLGEPDSAAKILRPLFQKHPKEYNIIANLGTCYELMGELDSALKYISLGYEINPKSHKGSEWIHIELLKAKIKEEQYPGWLDKNEIVSVRSLIAKVDTDKGRRDIWEINQNFFYQIRTRVPFTPAPNKVIANLLYTLGLFNQAVGTYENALLSYAYVAKFDPSLMKKMESSIRKLNTQRDEKLGNKKLPPLFLSMMKRSDIDIELLVMGVDDYAASLEMFHQAEQIKMDSLVSMKKELDSILLATDVEMERKDAKILAIQTSSQTERYIYLSVGLLLGIIFLYLFMKIRKTV